MQLSTYARSELAKSFSNGFVNLFGSSIIGIFATPEPADTDDAVTGSTLLSAAAISLPNASGKTLTVATLTPWEDIAHSGVGTMLFARIANSADSLTAVSSNDRRIQLPVGAIGSGEDVEIDDLAAAGGKQTSFTQVQFEAVSDFSSVSFSDSFIEYIFNTSSLEQCVSDNGIIKIYDGPIPTSANDAIDPSCNQLGEISDGFNNELTFYRIDSNGTIIAQDGEQGWYLYGAAAGTATFARWCAKSDDNSAAAGSNRRIQIEVSTNNQAGYLYRSSWTLTGSESEDYFEGFDLAISRGSI